MNADAHAEASSVIRMLVWSWGDSTFSESMFDFSYPEAGWNRLEFLVALSERG